MTVKMLFGLTVVPAAFLAGSLLACLGQRIRDFFFVLLVFLAPMIERLDVNFVSHEWYRGTSRGFEVSVLDILAMSLLASAVLRPRPGEARAYWPAGLGAMLLFFAYACFNVAIAEPQIFGCFGLFEMIRGLIVALAVAFYLRSRRELTLYLATLGALVCYEGLLALKQRYLDGIHRVPGSIDDSNSLSVFLCLTAPLFVAAINSQLPRPLKLLGGMAIALAGVGEILTISRAGLVTLGAMLLLTTLATIRYTINFRRVAITLAIMLAATGVIAKSWNTLKSRFKESNLQEEYGNTSKLGRGYYIRIAKAIAADRWFGVGFNNWSFWTSNWYGPKLGYHFVHYRGVDKEPSTIIPPGANVDEAQAAPAHSLGALTLGELGWPGFAVFCLVWLRWFSMGASFLWPRAKGPMRRVGVGLFFGLCGLFLQSLTEWVFWQAPIFYTFSILLGVLMALRHYARLQRAESAPKDYEMQPDGHGWAARCLSAADASAFRRVDPAPCA